MWCVCSRGDSTGAKSSKVSVLLLGLNNAGKTTLLYHCLLGSAGQHGFYPTKGEVGAADWGNTRLVPTVGAFFRSGRRTRSGRQSSVLAGVVAAGSPTGSPRAVHETEVVSVEPLSPGMSILDQL
jgi:hypothetical protein